MSGIDKHVAADGSVEPDGLKAQAPSVANDGTQPKPKRGKKLKASSDDASSVSVQSESGLPRFYEMRDSGLFYVSQDEPPAWISGRFKLPAMARTEESAGWSIVGEFVNGDGVTQVVTTPLADFYSNPSTVLRRYADKGLPIASSKKATERFIEAHVRSKIAGRADIRDSVGWHRGFDAYVLPNQTITKGDDIRVVFEPPLGCTDIETKGDLAEWKEGVCSLVTGHAYGELCLAHSFVGPMLKLCGSSGYGFNLVGPSSSAKTTLLRCAASTWGSRRFVRSWGMTTNGVEAEVVLRNDNFFAVDELGLSDGGNLGAMIFSLTDGRGKGRAKSDGSARQRRVWATAFMSTSELGIAAHIEQAGARSRAGHNVRMIDITIDGSRPGGFFDGSESREHYAALADAISDHTSRFYGSAGPEFIKEIIQRPDQIRDEAKRIINDFVKHHVPAGASGQVSRVGRCFALTAAAGEIAAALNILPFELNSITAAAARLFREWIAQRGGAGAAEDFEAVERMRHFLQLHHMSRFVVLGSEGSWRSQMVAGFKHKGGDHFYVNDAAFAEALNGLDLRLAADSLARLGYLVKDRQGKRKNVIKVEGRPTRLYKIKTSILSTLEKGDESVVDEDDGPSVEERGNAP